MQQSLDIDIITHKRGFLQLNEAFIIYYNNFEVMFMIVKINANYF